MSFPVNEFMHVPSTKGRFSIALTSYLLNVDSVFLQALKDTYLATINNYCNSMVSERLYLHLYGYYQTSLKKL